MSYCHFSQDFMVKGKWSYQINHKNTDNLRLSLWHNLLCRLLQCWHRLLEPLRVWVAKLSNQFPTSGLEKSNWRPSKCHGTCCPHSRPGRLSCSWLRSCANLAIMTIQGVSLWMEELYFFNSFQIISFYKNRV